MDGMNEYPSNFGPCRGISSISNMPSLLYTSNIVCNCALLQGDRGCIGLAFFNNPTLYIVLLAHP